MQKPCILQLSYGLSINYGPGCGSAILQLHVSSYILSSLSFAGFIKKAVGAS